MTSLAQLLELGLSRSGVRSWVARGRLHRVHRGVYAVGRPDVLVKGQWMAAVLACGKGAVLSHRSAAALHGLLPSARKDIDVTTSRRTGRTRGGIDPHRGATLRPEDVTEVDGIPCTTVARTLLDLSDVESRRRLERAATQAEVLRVYDQRAVDEVLGRANGRHGAPLLIAILKEHAQPALTRSELEERFFEICRTAGVPRPESNAWIALEDGGGYEADFLWRDRALIVETDGRAAHGTARAFEHDRERDQDLTVAGYRVVRFTWRQLERKPDEAARKVALLLRRPW